MKERKEVANRLASSLAEAVVRLPSKRRQRYPWAGHGAAKTAKRDADPVTRRPHTRRRVAWQGVDLRGAVALCL